MPSIKSTSLVTIMASTGLPRQNHAYNPLGRSPVSPNHSQSMHGIASHAGARRNTQPHQTQSSNYIHPVNPQAHNHTSRPAQHNRAQTQPYYASGSQRTYGAGNGAINSANLLMDNDDTITQYDPNDLDTDDLFDTVSNYSAEDTSFTYGDPSLSYQPSEASDRSININNTLGESVHVSKKAPTYHVLDHDSSALEENKDTYRELFQASKNLRKFNDKVAKFNEAGGGVWKQAEDTIEEYESAKKAAKSVKADAVYFRNEAQTFILEALKSFGKTPVKLEKIAKSIANLPREAGKIDIAPSKVDIEGKITETLALSSKDPKQKINLSDFSDDKLQELSKALKPIINQKGKRRMRHTTRDVKISKIQDLHSLNKKKQAASKKIEKLAYNSEIASLHVAGSNRVLWRSKDILRQKLKDAKKTYNLGDDSIMVQRAFYEKAFKRALKDREKFLKQKGISPAADDIVNIDKDLALSTGEIQLHLPQESQSFHDIPSSQADAVGVERDDTHSVAHPHNKVTDWLDDTHSVANSRSTAKPRKKTFKSLDDTLDVISYHLDTVSNNISNKTIVTTNLLEAKKIIDTHLTPYDTKNQHKASLMLEHIPNLLYGLESIKHSIHATNHSQNTIEIIDTMLDKVQEYIEVYDHILTDPLFRPSPPQRHQSEHRSPPALLPKPKPSHYNHQPLSPRFPPNADLAMQAERFSQLKATRPYQHDITATHSHYSSPHHAPSAEDARIQEILQENRDLRRELTQYSDVQIAQNPPRHLPKENHRTDYADILFDPTTGHSVPLHSQQSQARFSPPTQSHASIPQQQSQARFSPPTQSHASIPQPTYQQSPPSTQSYASIPQPTYQQSPPSTQSYASIPQQTYQQSPLPTQSYTSIPQQTYQQSPLPTQSYASIPQQTYQQSPLPTQSYANVSQMRASSITPPPPPPPPPLLTRQTERVTIPKQSSQRLSPTETTSQTEVAQLKEEIQRLHQELEYMKQSQASHGSVMPRPDTVPNAHTESLEIDRVKAENSSLRKSLTTHIEQLKFRDARIKQLEDSTKETNVLVDNLQNASSTMKTNYTNLQQQLLTQQQQLSTQQQQLELYKNNEVQYRNNEAQYRNNEAQYKNLITKFSNAEAQYKAREAELKNREEHYKATENQYKAREAELQNREEHYKAMETQYALNEAQLRGQINELNAQINYHESTLQEQENTIKEYQTDMGQKETESLELNILLNDKQTQLEEKAIEYENNLSTIRNSLREMRHKFHDRENALEEKLGELKLKNTQLTNQQKQISSLQAENSILRSQNESVSQDLSEHSHNLQRDNQALNEQVAQLQESLTEFKQLHEENEERSKAFDEVSEIAHSLEHENQSLKETIHKLRKALHKSSSHEYEDAPNRNTEQSFEQDNATILYGSTTTPPQRTPVTHTNRTAQAQRSQHTQPNSASHSSHRLKLPQHIRDDISLGTLLQNTLKQHLNATLHPDMSDLTPHSSFDVFNELNHSAKYFVASKIRKTLEATKAFDPSTDTRNLEELVRYTELSAKQDREQYALSRLQGRRPDPKTKPSKFTQAILHDTTNGLTTHLKQSLGHSAINKKSMIQPFHLDQMAADIDISTRNTLQTFAVQLHNNGYAKYAKSLQDTAGKISKKDLKKHIVDKFKKTTALPDNMQPEVVPDFWNPNLPTTTTIRN